MAGYFQNQDGSTIYVDDASRAFQVTPSGLVPIAGMQPLPPPPGASALPIMPQAADLRAQAKELAVRDGSFVRPSDGIYATPSFPTSLVKYVGAGRRTRRYSTGLLPTDGDYAVNSEAIRIIRFEMPSTIFVENGASFNTAIGNAFPVGVGPLDCFLYRSQTSNQELLDPFAWDTVDHLGNVFNRLVIFDAQQIHSAAGYFGHTADTGRLFQMFFFDV